MARCITADALHQAAVCVAANLDELTLNRREGSISIYVSLRATRAMGSKAKVEVWISAPANPSGVVLDEGAAGGLENTLTLKPGEEIKEVRVLKIHTAKTNPTSGRLTYYVMVKAWDSEGNVVEAIGSPLQIRVQTSP